MRPKRRTPSVDAILGGAERVFARVGYGEASLRQLMAESSVSTTAFYARFDSKEAVLKELVLRLLREIGEQVAETLPGARDLPEGFRVGVDVLCDALVPRRDLVRIMLTEAAASAAVTDALGSLYTQLASLLRSRLDGLAVRGAAKVVDTESAAWSLVGALHMQVLRWAVYGHLDEAAFRHAIHAVADSYLPALQPAAKTPAATTPVRAARKALAGKAAASPGRARR